MDIYELMRKKQREHYAYQDAEGKEKEEKQNEERRQLQERKE